MNVCDLFNVSSRKPRLVVLWLSALVRPAPREAEQRCCAEGPLTGLLHCIHRPPGPFHLSHKSYFDVVPSYQPQRIVPPPPVRLLRSHPGSSEVVDFEVTASRGVGVWLVKPFSYPHEIVL